MAADFKSAVYTDSTTAPLSFMLGFEGMSRRLIPKHTPITQ